MEAIEGHLCSINSQLIVTVLYTLSINIIDYRLYTHNVRDKSHAPSIN